jgi:predicted GNAT superfamily acetyltransferase
VTAPVVRLLHTPAELERCVAFQRLIWGDDFAEVVPAAILMVATRTGGVVAGAFDAPGQAADSDADALHSAAPGEFRGGNGDGDGDGDMIGFVFGITGFTDGAPLHWSDMLAVHPARRGTGVGRALKQFQRTVLLDRGITHVRWTFDPLEARNAHLNFNRLGVTAREYVRDLYGASTSPLHRGLPTDRLIVDWQLDGARVRQRMDGAGPGADAAARALADPAADPSAGAGTPSAEAQTGTPRSMVVNLPGAPLRLDLDDSTIRIRIPGDVQRLKAADIEAARAWRAATRAAFEHYFARGYTAVSVEGDGDGAAYLLERTGLDGA